jgi:hypothetical protein
MAIVGGFVGFGGADSECRAISADPGVTRQAREEAHRELPLVLNVRRRAPSRFIIRVSENSRTDADALCAELKAAGGACIVLRNPRD